MVEIYKRETNTILFDESKDRIDKLLKNYENKLINLSSRNRNIWNSRSTYQNFSIFHLEDKNIEEINKYLQNDIPALNLELNVNPYLWWNNLEKEIQEKVENEIKTQVEEKTEKTIKELNIDTWNGNLSEEDRDEIKQEAIKYVENNRTEIENDIRQREEEECFQVSFWEFQKIENENKKIKDEKGIDTFYFVPYYLYGTIEGTEGKKFSIRSPIFFIPIKIECKKSNRKILMNFDDKRSIIINNFILSFVLKINDTSEIEYDVSKSIQDNLKNIFSHENINKKDFSNEVLEFLKNYEDKNVDFKNYSYTQYYDVEIEKSFTIGFFNKYDNSLREDVIKIREQEIISDNLKYIIDDTRSHYDLEDLDFSFYYDKNKNTNQEDNIAYVDDLNYEQLIALKKINNENIKSLVVWGPPGTGKSQLIVSLIYDSILKGKRVALISEKKVALDVIYERLQPLQSFIFYLSDINDKSAFYENISDSIIESEKNSVKQNIFLNSENINVFNRNISYGLNELDKIDFNKPLKEFNNKNFNELIRNSKYYDIFSKGLNSESEYINNLEELFIYYDKKEVLNIDLNILKDNLWNIENFVNRHYENIEDSLDSYDWLEKKYFKYILDKDLFEKDFDQKKKNILSLISDEEQNIKEYKENKIFLYDEKIKNDNYIVKITSLDEEIKNAEDLYLKAKFFENNLIDFKKNLPISKASEWENKISDLRTQFKLFKLNYSDYMKLRFFQVFKKSELKAKAEKNWTKLIKNHPLDWDIDFVIFIFNLKNWNIIQKKYLNVIREYYSKYFNDEIENIFVILNQKENDLKEKTEININDIFKSQELIESYKNELDIIKDEELQISKNLDNINKFNQLSEFEFKIFKKYIYFSGNNLDFKTLLRRINEIENYFIFCKLQNNLAFNNLTNHCQKWQENHSFINKNILNKISFSKIMAFEELSKKFKKVYLNSKEKVGISRKVQSRRKPTIVKFLKSHYDIFKNMYQIWLMRPEVFSSMFDITEKFDLVIFDEASQVFIQRSIPAIQRAEKIVVLGDEKQLKPTDFFMSTFSEKDSIEEIEEVDKNFSLLDLAKSNYPKIMLKNHYRSDFKELIEFSNEHFYNGELEIITKKSSFVNDFNYKPIEYYYLDDAIYEDGYNKAEIKKVIDILYEIRNDIKFEGKTIGIVTVNAKQEEFIEYEILRTSWNDHTFSKWCNDVNLFIKNIENVQGDERDIIIFSSTYGKDSEGKQKHNFGPINKTDGSSANRLNVTITRSKIKMIVISSINLIDLGNFVQRHTYHSNNSKSGMFIFYEFLKYSQSISENNNKSKIDMISEMISNELDSTEFISPFQEDIYNTLKDPIKEKYNLEIIANHKDFGYEIDFLIFDNENKKPILLLETDGAMHHSSKPARLGDLSRQTFLEERGYKFYRIWSTNWFLKKGKETEVRKIFELLDQIMKK